MKRILVTILLLAIAVLVGYAISYRRILSLERQTSSLKHEMQSVVTAKDEAVKQMAFRLRLAKLDQDLSLVYVELNNANFGLAAQHLAHFQTGLRGLSDEAQAEVKPRLLELLPRVEPLQGKIQRMDLSARSEVERLFKDYLAAIESELD
ncbi:MAG: hypothetical protein HY652_01050 [Acidobacteria bacterium]|nr:hypothetical protein [Acidobacteriota bacterium]